MSSEDPGIKNLLLELPTGLLTTMHIKKPLVMGLPSLSKERENYKFSHVLIQEMKGPRKFQVNLDYFK